MSISDQVQYKEFGARLIRVLNGPHKILALLSSNYTSAEGGKGVLKFNSLQVWKT